MPCWGTSAQRYQTALPGQPAGLPSPDHGALARLRDCIRVALAWGSIVEDVQDGRLNIDQLQKRQAEKELQTADEVLPRVARECYRWLLSLPCNTRPPNPAVSGGVPAEHQRRGARQRDRTRVCGERTVITTWSPIHLRTRLQELYWKADKQLLEHWRFGRYPALPLPAATENPRVLEQAIVKGAASRDFFGTAYGQHEGTFDGFKLGEANIQLDDTLLLIEPANGAAIRGRPCRTSRFSSHSGGTAAPPCSTQTPLGQARHRHRSHRPHLAGHRRPRLHWYR